MSDGVKMPWDLRPSLSNLITIVTIAATIVFSWARFDARLGNVEKEVSGAAAKIEKLEAERSDLQARIIRIEEKISSQNDILQKILRNTEK